MTNQYRAKSSYLLVIATKDGDVVVDPFKGQILIKQTLVTGCAAALGVEEAKFA